MELHSKLIYADRVIIRNLLESVAQAEKRLAEANKELADRLKLHIETSETFDLFTKHPSV